MPEYLAPGVYVEETSFRARPIEGVSTSTTAFAGPTRKGPLGEPPELLTSVGDFERIYGGTENLSFSPSGALINYMAHAVRAYFDNGGSRLYVTRVFAPIDPEADTGLAASGHFVGAPDAAARARFVARMPGAVGNGRIELLELTSPATWKTMDAAPEGSLLRIGGANPERPASVSGGFPTFRVPNGSVLRLTVRDAANVETTADLTFQGAPAEVVAGADLADPVPLAAAADAAARTLVVTIDGREQRLVFAAADVPRATFLVQLNAALRGGFARLQDNRLVLGSDVSGTDSAVSVAAIAALGFGADGASGSGNVPDLEHVRIEDINTLLVASALKVRASLAPSTRRMQLVTTEAGAPTRITVQNAGDSSAHAAFGLALGATSGAAGATLTLYVKRGSSWQPQGNGPALVQAPGEAAPPGGADFLALNAVSIDGDGNARNYEDMGYDPAHPRAISRVLAEIPTRRADQLDNLYALEVVGHVDAFALRAGLLAGGEDIDADGDGIPESRRAVLTLGGGDDGLTPTASAYEAALRELLRLDDISIVAAPGSAALGPEWPAIRDRLVTHVERRRAYEILVLDTAPDLEPSGARSERSTIDSTRAAIYYPWIIASNPRSRPSDLREPREIALPPSGFVCGIYARNDIQRGVHKAPANEVTRGALRFQRNVSFGEQELLNPLGVNCLRSFPGRGHRVWGGRTASSDQEWKYVNVRRYFNYIEASVDRGTQWAVFEPNGEALWAAIRQSLEEFLYNEWYNGALLGATPKQAYFVHCDRSTMTQADLDNGRLICEVGIAVLKPAEFVIFRIGQKTADERN